MICQLCKKSVATVHVTEVLDVALGNPAVAMSYREQHVCEDCAQNMDLPHSASAKKTMADIWKLLQLSAQQTRKKGGPVCPSCGMSLDEFRKKGRLGCPKDYEVFKSHIGDLLERVHGARVHTGRLPGASEAELQKLQRQTELRHLLEVAIREEAYENAAQLRDEIKALEESCQS
jgi:protein arginine kinase activator